MLVYFRRKAFLRGVLYDSDSRGVEVPDDLFDLLPKDAKILLEGKKREGYINYPSPSGKGIPAVQPPENEFEQRPPPEGVRMDQKRVPPPIVSIAPAINEDDVDQDAQREKDALDEARKREVEEQARNEAARRQAAIAVEVANGPLPGTKPSPARIDAPKPTAPKPAADKPSTDKK